MKDAKAQFRGLQRMRRRGFREVMQQRSRSDALLDERALN